MPLALSTFPTFPVLVCKQGSWFWVMRAGLHRNNTGVVGGPARPLPETVSVSPSGKWGPY
jgi:hypothetical protein